MAITPKLGGKSCLHPGPLYDGALRLGTPLEFWGRANSYSCPIGPMPGSAWLLLRDADLDDLTKSAWHSLVWTDATRKLTITRLSIVRSFAINLTGDSIPARLVELQDQRRQLSMTSLNVQYNVRIPAPSATSGTGLYYTASLNGAAAWTWQTLVDDIWDELPSTAGTAPTLPYTPDGTPEGWRFIGVSAWEALHSVLGNVGCTTSYDPIADTFDYVRLGDSTDEQAALDTKFAALTGRLMYDHDHGFEYQLAHMPEKIRVFFQRRETYHGIEKDTPDSDQWEMTPVVSKDVATNVTGALTGTVLNVWDDLPALHDDAGTNTNSADLTTRAAEIAANIERRIDKSDERLQRMYSGLVTNILTDSLVSEVRWRDYGDRHSLVTEIIRTPVRSQQRLGANGGGGTQTSDKLNTPDFARATHPLWPRLGQPVQVDDGASTTGDLISANGSGLFPGFVIRWAGGAWSTLEACWIRPVDLESTGTPSEATVIQLRQKDRLVGRLSGSQTHSGDTRPVYLVRSGVSESDDPSADDPWFVIEDNVTPTAGTENLNYGDTFKFTAACSDVWDVKKAGAVTTIDLDASPPPIGSIIMSYLAPIESDPGVSDKFYIDRNGAADTCWALMDGVSNVSPGSGIKMWDRGINETGNDRIWFARGRPAMSDATDTEAGRPAVASPNQNNDEVTIEVEDHADHIHQFNTDACHGDVAAPDVHFDFSTSATQNTSIQKTTGGGAMKLEHTVTLTNHQGSASNKIEMMPPSKGLHFFERVA